MQYFFMAAFRWMLIEAIYFYFFVVKVYNINTKMYMHHVISWGKFIILKLALVTVVLHAFGSPNMVLSSSELLWFSFFPLWVGLPMITVAISLAIAAGKEGLQSYTSDK